MPEGLTADQSEIMLRKRQKRDSNSVINRLRIEPEAKSRFSIPLSTSHPASCEAHQRG